MKRVSVIGCCGAGKSTLSKRLSELTGLPVVHLDKEFWREAWEPSDRDDFRERMIAVYEREEWIIDGHYFSTMDDRLKNTDTVYHLDYTTARCFYQTLKRIITGYGRDRDDCAMGCPERFDWEHIRYVLAFRQTFRNRTLELLSRHTHLEVVSFTHPSELEAHFNDLSDQVAKSDY